MAKQDIIHSTPVRDRSRGLLFSPIPLWDYEGTSNYIGYSKNNASYLFPQKLQQIQRAQKQYWTEHILSYKALFLIVTTISYAFLPAMNKSLHAVLIKIYTSRGGPLAQLQKCITHHLTALTSTVWAP